MSASVIRAHAASLPLPDGSVDLIVTSPPYFGLRSYTDGGEHYPGQIGSEATPTEWLEALWACTREWVRVLKPEGSLFVNLGDKYDSGTTTARVNPGTVKDGQGQGWHQGTPRVSLGSPKSLLGLPWRYAIGCMDRLGLILRAEIVWAKPNGLPESVTDRVRRAHEQVFHFTLQPRYYSAVDEIREPHAEWTLKAYAYEQRARARNGGYNRRKNINRVDEGDAGDYAVANPLGKLPGSVWDIPSQPLQVPAHLGVDHFAAFPMELPRRVILGWSPPGVCTGCGQGRRPIVDRANRPLQRVYNGTLTRVPGDGREDYRRGVPQVTEATITGYACACGQSQEVRSEETISPQAEAMATPSGETLAVMAEGLVPELRKVSLPPTRPAVVVDPFGGTGTTALVASVLGRHGITADLSADYGRLARWRVNDPGERARALQVPKPPPVMDGQEALFGL